MINWTSSKLKSQVLLLKKTLVRKQKRKAREFKKVYLEYIDISWVYLVKNLYPQYMRNSYNSIRRKPIQVKYGHMFWIGISTYG